MNINLLSPSKNENGFSYNVRFRENIEFKPNAKVYLNYATFSRESEVSFTEDQTITLTNMEFLPEVLPQTPFTATNEPATVKVTIPKINSATNTLGYTFPQLQNTIETQLNSLVSQNQLKIYSSFGEQTAEDLKEKDVGIGYYIESNNNVVPQTFLKDASNSRDGGEDATNDYIKTSATGTTGARTFLYDNYAISDTHYFHPFVECEEEATISFIEGHVNKSINDLDGAVTFGLYSKEYAGNAGDASADRTTGTGATTGAANSNPKLVRNNATISSGDVNVEFGTIAAFVTVEVTPLAAKGVNRNQNNNSTIIRIAKSTSANNTDIRSFTGINTNIQGMRQIFRINNTLLTGSQDENVKLVLQTYYTNEDSNLHLTARKLYFKLINVSKNHSVTDPANIVYDSRRHNYFIPMAFFTGTATSGGFSNAKNTDIVNSRIPFNVIASAQEQNEGFSHLVYSNFDKSLGTSAAPLSILMNYKLSFSSELARYVGSGASEPLYPNTCETRSEFIHIKNFRLDWLNDSYAILIKNLPIINYKNTGTESNGGFGKAIIANVPTPFKDFVEQTLDNKKVITGVYQPSYPVILELKNPSKFELNNFDISIVNIRDETEVQSLVKSNVSFTIQ